jgi:NTE family protein
MKPVRVALSGSGFLAGIHVGAVAALVDSGYTIVEIAGTSGGSIVAAAVALGLDKDALYKLAVDTDFAPLLHGGPMEYLSSAGWDNGVSLEDYLDSILGGKTLKEACMPVQILATDVHAKGVYTFSPTATPDVKMSLACRASCAVPFIYAPVIFGGVYLADGGMCSNIPVDRLVVDKALRVGVSVEHDDAALTSPPWSYARTLISLLLSANASTEMHLAEATGARIIKVASREDPLDVRMLRDVKLVLYQAGYQATLEALEPAHRPLTSARVEDVTPPPPKDPIS